MERDLYNFLKEIFKSPTFDEVLRILTESGVENWNDLQSASTLEELEYLGLKKIQAMKIFKQLHQNSSLPNVNVTIPNASVSEQSQHKQEEELKLPEKSYQDVQPLQIEENKMSLNQNQNEIPEEQIDTSAPQIKDDEEMIDLSKSVVDENVALSSKLSYDHVLETSMKNYVIYESYEDAGAEYKMNKIKLNEKDYTTFVRDIKQSEVQIIGFIGNFEKLLYLISEYLGTSTNFDRKIQEGLIFFKNKDKIAVALKINEEIYDYNKPADSSHMFTIYTRYLIDICAHIILAPSEHFRLNPDTSNPFIERMNPGFKLQQKIIEPDLKVSIFEIPIVESQSRSKGQQSTSLDYSKFLWSHEVSSSFLQEEIKHEVRTMDIEKLPEYGYRGSYFKNVTFSQLKEQILEKWIQDNYFFYEKHEPRKFEYKITQLLEKFVPYEERKDLKQKIKELQNEYSDNYKTILSKYQDMYEIEIIPLYKDLVGQLKEMCCYNYKQVLEKFMKESKQIEEPQSKGFWENLKNMFVGDKKEDKLRKLECDHECYSFQALISYKQSVTNFKSIDWDLLKKTFLEDIKNDNKFIHKIFKKPLINEKLEELVKELKRISEENGKLRRQECQEFRTKILLELFEFCDSKVEKTKKLREQTITISFEQINIIRDKGHKITNWNTSKLPNRVRYTFPKQYDEDIKVQEVYFLKENSGLALISNSPPLKSSIYYFNISKKDQVYFTQYCTLSSNEANFKIEPYRNQWLSYDNKEKRFNMGKISKEGKIEDGAPVSIYHRTIDGKMIQSIKTAVFLPNEDKILLIDQDLILYEYKYQARELKQISKKANTGGDRVTKTYLRPDNQSEFYDTIQTSSDGKKVILKSQHFIDIYDLSWERVSSFHLSEKFIQFKTFNDGINEFLTIFEEDNQRCFQIVGLTSSTTIDKEMIENQQFKKSNGNPIFDYIYLSFKKFGPHSHFIGSPNQTQFKFLIPNNEIDKTKLNQYFQQLKMNQITLKILSNEEIQKNGFLKENQSKMRKRVLCMILAGRLAIHIATIENFTLLPLQNGLNISDQISDILIQNQGNSDLISRLISFIKFGIYDQFIKGIQDQVKVISIVGRQSSGKSYVLNRFFGTRFNVATTRCTDGIWMSGVELYTEDGRSKFFIILDCEGLFSARRNDQEEMKLCLALSAVSDILILNQDLSFNRYLNSLFNNFTKSIGRIKGKKLFQGVLMVLIRDIKDEAENAYLELQSNIAQIQDKKQDSFLSKVFKGQLLSQCLNYFQQPTFTEEVEWCRTNYFFSLDQERWKNGNDFLESLKITLAQIFLDDDTDMDIHKMKIFCNNLFNQALQMFFQGGNYFCEDDIFQMKIKIQEKDYEIKFNQSEYSLIKENLNEAERNHEQEELPQELIQSFFDQSCEYSLINHNEWLTNYYNFIEGFLNQRQELVLSYFQKQIPENNDEFEDIVKSHILQMKQIINSYVQKSRKCRKTCFKCSRLCVQFFNHLNNCDCETGHICQLSCEITDNCKEYGYKCVERYGHEGDHRCGDGNHKCPFNCSIKDCAFLCSEQSGHEVGVHHNCGNKHPCPHQCYNASCTRSCQFDITNEHEFHDCGTVKCIHRCQFCDFQCIFPHHFHQELINSKENEKLEFPIEGGELITMNYHHCGNEHQCKEICEERGVCQIDYKAINKIWKNTFGEFEYLYFEPKDSKSQCKIQIPKFLKNHEDNHSCKIGQHRCFEQCSECKSYCAKYIDHEGQHDTKNHRNKENSVFVSLKDQKKLEIVIEGNKRAFTPGESAAPENCQSACQRKGRAHYHIKECPGPELCEAKMNPQVQHALEKFYPFEDKVFDKWLCQNYWNSLDWEPPVDNEIKDLNNCCNFICAHRSHGDDKNFCLLKAWHEDKHQFDCDHGAATSFANLDIVFCCDTTGSMSSYIDRSKVAVKKIIETATELIKDSSVQVQFGFTAYKDHPPQDTTYVTQFQDLCNESTILSFINSLSASGGGDGPEAVMDGLYDSIFKTSWRKDTAKYIFHICDAPPHGSQYSSSGDGFPSGCPCGITIEKLAEGLKEKNIMYKLLQIGSYPNQMATIFKTHIEDFEVQDLESSIQLDIKMAEILVRDIKCNELDFKV